MRQRSVDVTTLDVKDRERAGVPEVLQRRSRTMTPRAPKRSKNADWGLMKAA